MPDEDKTTNTNQPLAGGAPVVDPPSPTVEPTTPAPPPTATSDISDQAIDTPPPPPMEDGAVSPPPPIVEEKKPEETTTPTQKTEKTESAQAIPDIPPVITTSGAGGKKPANKKMIATILGVLFLVGGIGAGVILVQNQQDIREWARVFADCERDSDCGGDYECSDGDCVLPTTPYVPTSEPDPEPDPAPSDPDPALTCYGGVAIGDYACSTYYTCVECLSSGTYSGSVDAATYCTGLPCDPNTQEDSGKLDYGRDCTEDDQCYSGICTNGKCGAPSTRFCEGDTCDLSFAGKSLSDSCFIMHYSSDDNDDSTITDNVIAQGVSRASMGAVDCGAEQIDVACGGAGFVDGLWERYSDDCTDTPLTPGVSASCLNIQAFDTEWNSITSLSSLVTGDVVRFTVAGTTSSGSFDKARFNINGTFRSEVSVKKPGTEEFYDEYTIPENITTFTIDAEVHHTTLGWF